MTSEQFLSELRAELVAAAERAGSTTVDATDAGLVDTDPPDTTVVPLTPRSNRGRRNRLLALWAAAAVALIAVLGGLLALRSEPTPTGVEIERRDGDVTIIVTDHDLRADQIEDEARRAGVDLTVAEVVTAPENVGRIIASALSPGLEFLHEDPDDPGSPVDGVRIPAGHSGPLRIQYGVAAAPGQDWNRAPDATDKGQLLECLDLRGETLERVLLEIQERGLRRVRVQILNASGSTEIYNAELADHLDATFISADVMGEDQTILVVATDDGTRVPDLPTRAGCD